MKIIKRSYSMSQRQWRVSHPRDTIPSSRPENRRHQEIPHFESDNVCINMNGKNRSLVGNFPITLTQSHGLALCLLSLIKRMKSESFSACS